LAYPERVQHGELGLAAAGLSVELGDDALVQPSLEELVELLAGAFDEGFSVLEHVEVAFFVGALSLGLRFGLHRRWRAIIGIVISISW
jgi:hypothetical protein